MYQENTEALRFQTVELSDTKTNPVTNPPSSHQNIGVLPFLTTTKSKLYKIKHTHKTCGYVSKPPTWVVSFWSPFKGTPKWHPQNLPSPHPPPPRHASEVMYRRSQPSAMANGSGCYERSPHKMRIVSSILATKRRSTFYVAYKMCLYLRLSQMEISQPGYAYYVALILRCVSVFPRAGVAHDTLSPQVPSANQQWEVPSKTLRLRFLSVRVSPNVCWFAQDLSSGL